MARIKNITEQLVSLSAADEEDKEICDLDKILASRPVDAMLKRLRSEGFEVIVEPSGDNPEFAQTKTSCSSSSYSSSRTPRRPCPRKGR